MNNVQNVSISWETSIQKNIGLDKKTLSGLNASFVNVGSEKDAFLHYHDLGPQLASLKKFTQQVSTGKRKDYTLKNFQIEKDIDKHGKIDDAIKVVPK